MIRPTPCLVLLPIVAALAVPAAAAAQTTEHTVSAVGTGTVRLAPDRGSFSAGVTRRAATGNAARAQASRRIRAIVAGVRAVGVTSAQIQTEYISVSRVHRKGHPIAYRATSSVDVDADSIETLGRAIDAATARGATEVYGPDLTFSPALRADALKRSANGALTDARQRAEAAAAAEGQHITGVQSIDLDPTDDSVFAAADSSGSSAAGGGRTKIHAGRQDITASARVTYTMEANAAVPSAS